jgi:hypothetical protein
MIELDDKQERLGGRGVRVLCMCSADVLCRAGRAERRPADLRNTPTHTVSAVNDRIHATGQERVTRGHVPVAPQLAKPAH